MKIRHLGLLLVGLLLAFGVAFSLSLWRVINQFESSAKTVKASFQSIALPLRQMDANTKNLRFHLYASFMHDERQDVSKYHTHPLTVHSDAILSSIESNRRLWEELAPHMVNPEMGVDLRALKDIYDAYYKKGIDPGIKAVEAKKWDDIVITVTGSLGEYGAFEKAMTAQLAAIAQAQDANAEKVRTTQRNELLLLALFTLVLMCGAGLLIWRTISGVARRMLVVTESANAMSNGDLSVIPTDDGRDEAAEVMRAVSAMQLKLSSVISTVRGSAESVATASSEIAQGNQDLSQRTETQASALQRTTVTMDQLGTTVRTNADSAKLANQLAQGASSVAAQGGEVVGRVVATMQGISDSSRKINDIISVIDGIAFQTNILALNAAVEAARAGEQGRGFAVVASEVRSLAQRSAEAAKEIKTLIGKSVEQVEQGTVLVDQAGKTMGEIVGSIQRVSDIVAEITSASEEQSSGVKQVANAVIQMDQATQQNAALVEESAAAAESLRAQAQQLVQAVALFKLSQDKRNGSSIFNPPPVQPSLMVTSPTSHSIAKNESTVKRIASTNQAPQKRPIELKSPTHPSSKEDSADWETF